MQWAVPNILQNGNFGLPCGPVILCSRQGGVAVPPGQAPARHTQGVGHQLQHPPHHRLPHFISCIVYTIQLYFCLSEKESRILKEAEIRISWYLASTLHSTVLPWGLICWSTALHW